MKERPRMALDDGSAPESEAAVLSASLGQRLTQEVDDFFAAHDVTVRQFNVLRILYVRDPNRTGISRGAIEQRLIQRGPDVTRLLDRLEAAGLIDRYRPKNDQRTVLSRLTDKGFDLIERTHAPLLALNRRQFAHMSKGEVEQLIALLRKAFDRSPSAGQ